MGQDACPQFKAIAPCFMALDWFDSVYSCDTIRSVKEWPYFCGFQSTPFDVLQIWVYILKFYLIQLAILIEIEWLNILNTQKDQKKS